MPASRSRSSRSTPIAPPSSAATPSRRTTCQSPTVGIALAARSSNGLILVARQVFDPRSGKVEQVVEPRPVERHLLRSRLHLDEAPVACHHDVHVHVSVRVLG